MDEQTGRVDRLDTIRQYRMKSEGGRGRCLLGTGSPTGENQPRFCGGSYAWTDGPHGKVFEVESP